MQYTKDELRPSVTHPIRRRILCCLHVPEDLINRLYHQPVARTWRRRLRHAPTAFRQSSGDGGSGGCPSRIRPEHRVRLARAGRTVRKNGSAEAAQYVFDQWRRGRLVHLVLGGVLVEHMIVRIFARSAGVLVAAGCCRETGAAATGTAEAAGAVVEEQRFLRENLQAFVVASGVRQIGSRWTYANGDLE